MIKKGLEKKNWLLTTMVWLYQKITYRDSDLGNKLFQVQKKLKWGVYFHGVYHETQNHVSRL